MSENGQEKKNAKRSRKRIIWIVALSVVLLALVAGGVEAYRILYTPASLFPQTTIDPSLLASQNVTLPPTLEPEDSATPEVVATTATASPTPTPTIAPTPTPGITQSQDILNILLIGIDRRQGVDGDNKGTPKSEGTDPHADVQMIVAINFKQKKVDLISLPRDTFVYNPDLMQGVYKLNATFNVGGGFAAKDNAGFMNVCKGAEYMLGGIPVDYYYAVDFNAVVHLVNAIGGVDYDVDSPSYSRKHKKGMQHMDGLDVLFYLRTRKVGPAPGDLNRINRQKDMMVAIFEQLKKKGKLATVPKLISAANSGVYTNLNLEQTLSLANYARSINPKKIGMHSLVGPSSDALYWRWCFTDQKKRIDVIKQVYGVDVPEQVHYSLDFAHWLRNYGFGGMVYLGTARQMANYADAHKADFNAEQQKAYDALSAAYTEAQKAFDKASLTMKSKETGAMKTAMNKLKTKATGLAKLLNYKGKLSWTYDHHYWWLDPQINKVKVDFN